ncbi:DapH/DapD/GlmU-related protein [Paenibacillus odorifer]|jgi:hypothetical protein|uniref:DapH/DapD/GlmU-related protein n=1 Tax=Paenibacillus odorifer TaxID=189426 RepID=UPI00096E5E64|nr:DapH/DapD/GlmU-related protein [Paenibacillus odorifer]OMD89413.1 hypothetical protein BSK67_25145 [Paenibacillus odorifer]
MASKIFIGVRGLFFFIQGNLIAFFRYDRKYLKGKYFKGRLGGICTIGWEWVVKDFWGGVFSPSINTVKAPWPTSPKVHIGNWSNLEFDINDLHIFQTYGTYFQALDGKIKIGKGAWIAPNVGIITSNHNLLNLEERSQGRDVIIGENCWIGMNAVILPGVILGSNTVVGAGAIVTKSFPLGNCVIAGNPAKLVKYIEFDK